MLVTLNGGN